MEAAAATAAPSALEVKVISIVDSDEETFFTPESGLVSAT